MDNINSAGVFPPIPFFPPSFNLSLHDALPISPAESMLSMDATAKTFRYLDEEEMAAQKQAAEPAKGKKK